VGKYLLKVIPNLPYRQAGVFFNLMLYLINNLAPETIPYQFGERIKGERKIKC
jgi:hypothetical protein